MNLMPRDTGKTFREEMSHWGIFAAFVAGSGLWLMTSVWGFLLWPIAAVLGALARSRGSRSAAASSRGYAARRSWLGRIVPAAMVAATRRMSAHFRFVGGGRDGLGGETGRNGRRRESAP